MVNETLLNLLRHRHAKQQERTLSAKLLSRKRGLELVMLSARLRVAPDFLGSHVTKLVTDILGLIFMRRRYKPAHGSVP